MQNTIKYIDSEIVLGEIKNTLDSYFDQGSIDDSLIYPVLLSCLATLGTKVLPSNEVVLVAQGGKVKLPDNFYRIEKMLGCSLSMVKNKSNPNITNWEERTVCEIPICKTAADYCTDSCNNLFEIVQTREEYTTCVKEFYPLNLTSEALNFCQPDTGCDSTSKYQVTLINGYLHLNFTGSIYLKYLATIANENTNEILIPDYPQLINWIKDSVIVALLEKMYLNGNNDVFQRLQYMQNKLTVSGLRANSFINMNEVSDFTNLGTILANRKGGLNSIRRRLK